MNTNSQMFRSTRKTTVLLLLACSSQLSAITSTMAPRAMGTSPLLYKMIDYSAEQTSYEIEPIFSAMYDSNQVNRNIILGGKNSLILDQQGQGDINPVWLNLMSNNSFANYNSTITFMPRLTQSGALFHFYDQFDSMFFDVKTALVQCKSEIEISEVGGGNGLEPGILNAQQAFTQADWNYGKIGASNHVVGLDNIELRFGKISKATSNASTYDLFMSAFGIIEAPTGSGTKAEWLFEPLVGTNHWGLGFGFESLMSGGDDLQFMIAGNYRYLTPAWETRSFDLLGNGQWSRYLAVQDIYGLPTAPATLGLPGINFFTQQAYIKGRSELNIYTRLAKQFKSSYFELSYNFLCIQKESIGAIKNITPNYGIYALTGPGTGGGGVTTSSTATINQDVTTLDSITAPIAVTTANFDKLSAAASTYASNTVAARLEITNNKYVYGFGASIQAAQSASAMSSWAVWAKFEYLFDNIRYDDTDIQFPTELYDFDQTSSTIIHHPIIMDENNLPQDVVTSIEDDFLDEQDSFEFDADLFDLQEDELETFDKELFEQEIVLMNDEIELVNEQLNQDFTAEQNDDEAQKFEEAQPIESDNKAQEQAQSNDATQESQAIESDDKTEDVTEVENVEEVATPSIADATIAIDPKHITNDQPNSISFQGTIAIAPEHVSPDQVHGITLAVEPKAENKTPKTPTTPSVTIAIEPELISPHQPNAITIPTENEAIKTETQPELTLPANQPVALQPQNNSPASVAPAVAVAANTPVTKTETPQEPSATPPADTKVIAMSNEDMLALLQAHAASTTPATTTPAPNVPTTPAVTPTPTATKPTPMTEEEILNKLDSTK